MKVYENDHKYECMKYRFKCHHNPYPFWIEELHFSDSKTDQMYTKRTLLIKPHPSAKPYWRKKRKSMKFAHHHKQINLKAIPLTGTEYFYIGQNTNTHQHGQIYQVVETGIHWIKEFGVVVWITTEENKQTRDIDDCQAFRLDVFHRLFWN